MKSEKKPQTLLDKALCATKPGRRRPPLTGEELELLFAFLQGALTHLAVANALTERTDKVYNAKAYSWITNAARRAFQDGQLLRD